MIYSLNAYFTTVIHAVFKSYSICHPQSCVLLLLSQYSRKVADVYIQLTNRLYEVAVTVW